MKYDMLYFDSVVLFIKSYVLFLDYRKWFLNSDAIGMKDDIKYRKVSLKGKE